MRLDVSEYLMASRMIVALKRTVQEDADIDTKYLRRKALYKTLSLLLAHRARIDVPPTLLMVNRNQRLLKRVIRLWGLPLMVRMDYQALPKKKTIGGIPLYTEEAIRNVADFLYSEGCYPLFHPHLDRFEDLYSAGILFQPGDHDIQVEAVGAGFDAGDLRLALTVPQECLTLDSGTGTVTQRWIASPAQYAAARARRFDRRQRLLEYTRFVNRNGKLLPSLDDFGASKAKVPQSNSGIPEAYEPLPRSLLTRLWEIARTLKSNVLEDLPDSNAFVGSLSFIKARWILWDVYGHWYAR